MVMGYSFLLGDTTVLMTGWQRNSDDDEFRDHISKWKKQLTRDLESEETAGFVRKVRGGEVKSPGRCSVPEVVECVT